MNKRKRLGQHFLKSETIARAIVDSACITPDDTVLEVGTGRGILTRQLCNVAKHVTSVESDRELYEAAKSMKINNLTLLHGDGFSLDGSFTIFVSNLPYSESKRAIEWLAQRRDISHAVVMVQKEFADKLTAALPSERRAISVIAGHSFAIRQVTSVGRDRFDPPPKVDSVVLDLQKRRPVSKELISTVNRMFSYRRKTLQNILGQFGLTSERSEARLDELAGDEIIGIARQIARY